MEKFINGFTCQAKNELYEKAEKKFNEDKESKVWEKVNKEFMGFFGQIILFIVFAFLALLMDPKKGTILVLMLFIYIPIWLYNIVTRKKRKQEAFDKKMKKNKYQNEIETKNIFNIFLEGKQEVKKLGNTFYVKSNNITGSRKRIYFGEVLISLDSNPCTIYIVNEKEYCKKDFVISDIIGFKIVSSAGLEDNKDIEVHNKYIEKVVNSRNQAEQLELEAQISKITDKVGGLNTVHSQVMRDKARLQAKEARDELEEKTKQEKERLRDEQYIRILEFKDGDYLLISHLVHITVTELEKKIELQ